MDWNRDSLRGKYLDCHVHTAGIGAGGSGCFLSSTLRRSYKFKIYLRAFGVTEQELKDSGDALVLDRISAGISASKFVGGAVVLAMDGVIDATGALDTNRTQVYIPNEFLAKETRKRPGLFFGASVNPRRADALRVLDSVAAQGAVLVKWIPSIMRFDPADSANIPFYLEMKRLGLPLLSHTGKESSFIDAEDSLCDPARLELPLRLGVTVIMAHCGVPGKNHGEPNVDRAIRLLGRYPNAYADISSLTQINKLGFLGRVLSRPEARGKLIYGSDFPLVNTPLVSPYYHVFRAHLTELRQAARESNPWDQDVRLKQALGASRDIFEATEKLLLKSK